MSNQLPNATINFEQLANLTVQQTMEGSDTPFRDALQAGFNLVGNTIATADALVCGIRYYAEDWKHESAHDFINKSAKLDQKATESTLMRQLRNKELLKAMNTDTAVSVA